MTAGAIASMVIIWALFIGTLVWCFSRMGKGGAWED